MATVLITGGTGLIGTALVAALSKRGYGINMLTRDPAKHPPTPGVQYFQWDIDQQRLDEKAIAGADHIIHLAGAGVADKRWTAKRKREIVDSRVRSGELLVKMLESVPNKIKTLVSASAIGWYGPDKKTVSAQPFSETDPPFDDFLGTTCVKWEDSTAPVVGLGIRLVRLRTGIVLSSKGGALSAFKKPLRFRVATILGNGKQVVSWIHIDDLVNMYIAAIENAHMHGSYNAVAPHPVTNRELVLTLARAEKKKFITMHVPAFMLRLLLGEMSVEVLKSATVSASKILETGFAFKYDEIIKALIEC